MTHEHSGKSRQKHSGLAFMFREARTEFLSEKGFFAKSFYVEGEPDNDHGKQGADFAESNGGSQKREQNAGVDGMANHAVGTGAYQFVTFFEGDDSAPICAQVPPRPKSYADSRSRQQNAKPFTGWTCGKEAVSQPAIKGL